MMGRVFRLVVLQTEHSTGPVNPKRKLMVPCLTGIWDWLRDTRPQWVRILPESCSPPAAE